MKSENTFVQMFIFIGGGGVEYKYLRRVSEHCTQLLEWLQSAHCAGAGRQPVVMGTVCCLRAEEKRQREELKEAGNTSHLCARCC